MATSKKVEIEIGAKNTATPQIDQLAKQLGDLKTQVAGFVGVNLGSGMIKDALATADAFNNLQARIKLATGAGPEFTAAFKEVSDIALRTGGNLEQTGILFGKLTDAGKAAGLSTQAAIAQSLGLTETISKAVQLSGGSAEASKAALTQLIQGLQSGVLRGDEFNSVMEQAPRLSKALADSLGVTTGELRKMAEAGSLTADTVIKGLKSQAGVINSEFATLPATVGRSIEKLQTQWALYIGELDKGNGITAKVAKGVDLLANNLNTVIETVKTAGAVYVGYNALQKLAAAEASIAAAKIVAQGVASTEAAVATRAHGVAAGAATAQVAAYGAASGAAAGQVAAGATGTVSKLASFTSSIAGFVGKLGAYGAAAYAVFEVGKLGVSAADSLLRKISGLDAAEKKLAETEKASTEAAKANKEAIEAQAAAKQAAIDKSFGLNAASSALVAKFGELTKAGDTSAEAIAKIGKDFNLGDSVGIKQASSILAKLSADGKISAEDFKKAWSDALKGEDLAQFEVKARLAFANTVAGAAQLQQALDQGVREAIKRTGLDFDVISGGMGKAAISAINDTDAIIKGLDRLKAQGVDTAQALTASLGKAINTADSEKALAAIKSQIEQVRSALGDKVADGLLDQAKTKALELKDALDAALPGIQNAREAMKQLGVTSDAEFKAIAEKSKTAFDTMKESGVGSARELSDAFKKVAADAIAANGGVAPEWVKTEAAVRGVTIAVDANGKATVDSARQSREAIGGITQSWDAAAAAAGRAAQAAVNAKYSKPEGGRNTELSQGRNDPMAIEYIFALREKLEKGTLTAADATALANAVETLKNIWEMDQAVMKLDPGAIDPSGVRSSMEWANVGRRMEDVLRQLQNPRNSPTPDRPVTPASQNTGANTTQSGQTNSQRSVTVHINTPKGRERVYTDDAGAEAIVRSLSMASKAAGR